MEIIEKTSYLVQPDVYGLINKEAMVSGLHVLRDQPTGGAGPEDAPEPYVSGMMVFSWVTFPSNSSWSLGFRTGIKYPQ